MELISPGLRIEFQDFCANHLVLRQIEQFFSNNGISLGQTDKTYSSERRTLVEKYYSSLDWTNQHDAQKFLNVISTVWAQSYIELPLKTYLYDLCHKEGLRIEGNKIYLTTKSSGANVKNLIFAADGPKPEIVLSDAVNNDIKVVKNAEFCLVYTEPILDRGLLWKDLVDWYRELNSLHNEDEDEIGRILYSRLDKSLASKPEKVLFFTYFAEFHKLLSERLPALVPQVYLHYDPYTLRQLEAYGKKSHFFRQRMDFLLLFSSSDRVVIEVDGQQHYSLKDKTASPKLYSEMVAEDRKLRLAGYEIYRFGGFELVAESGKQIVKDFFTALFRKHGLYV